MVIKRAHLLHRPRLSWPEFHYLSSGGLCFPINKEIRMLQVILLEAALFTRLDKSPAAASCHQHEERRDLLDITVWCTRDGLITFRRSLPWRGMIFGVLTYRGPVPGKVMFWPAGPVWKVAPVRNRRPAHRHDRDRDRIEVQKILPGGALGKITWQQLAGQMRPSLH